MNEHHQAVLFGVKSIKAHLLNQVI
jgi:hypothetical protein